MVNPYCGIHSAIKTNEILTHTMTDEFQKLYARWKKLYTKDKILHNSIYIKF